MDFVKIKELSVLKQELAINYDANMTTEMMRHFQVYPKFVCEEFAIVYASDHLPPELKLELEIVLGLMIKFEEVEEEKILHLIEELENKEGQRNRLAV
jgi:predicted Zn-dependent peptidase